MSIAELHHITQIAMGRDDEHLFSYLWQGLRDCPRERNLHSGNTYKVLLRGFDFGVSDQISHAYNFTEYWLCDIPIDMIKKDAHDTILNAVLAAMTKLLSIDTWIRPPSPRWISKGRYFSGSCYGPLAQSYRYSRRGEIDLILNISVDEIKRYSMYN